MTKRLWFYGAVSASFFAGAAAILYWTDRRSAIVAVNQYEIPVEVAQAIKTSVPAVIQLRGELHAVNEIEVNSQVPGKVTHVYYSAGDWVPRGALVASVNSSELEERVKTLEAATVSARADLQAKEGQLVEAENQLQKTRELFERNFIARRDLDQSRGAVESADAEVELARSRLAQQQAMLLQGRQVLSLTRIRAPVSGVIVRRIVEPGSTIRSSAAIVAIGSAERLKVKLRVDAKDLPLIAPGVNAKVHSEDQLGTSAEGKILGVENPQGSSAVNIEIDIQVSSWNRKFQIGQSVVVSIPSRTSEHLVLIPKPAIVETGGKTYLFKLIEGRAVKTEVIVDDRENGNVAVTGLSEGERVILRPPPSLKPDSRLKILLPPIS